MDIFTILVFFLLVNSSDVEVLTNDKSIELPASVADTVPETTVVVKVNSEHIMVGGRVVVSDITAIAATAGGDTQNNIAALTQELKYLAGNARELTAEQQQTGRPITIMGDKTIEYALLKKIMNTCAQAGYRDISLAVNKTASSDSEAVTTTGANQ